MIGWLAKFGFTKQVLVWGGIALGVTAFGAFSAGFIKGQNSEAVRQLRKDLKAADQKVELERKARADAEALVSQLQAAADSEHENIRTVIRTVKVKDNRACDLDQSTFDNLNAYRAQL